MHSYIEKATKNLSLSELSMFALVFNRLKKKEWKTALLCFIGGGFGIHRFYLNDIKGGIILAFITIFTFGLGAIFGLMDLLAIKKLTEKSNEKLVFKLVKEIKRR